MRASSAPPRGMQPASGSRTPVREGTVDDGATKAESSFRIEATHADTPEKLNAFINARQHGAGYAEAMERCGRRSLGEIDMTINNEKVHHTPQMVPIR